MSQAPPRLGFGYRPGSADLDALYLGSTQKLELQELLGHHLSCLHMLTLGTLDTQTVWTYQKQQLDSTELMSLP